MSGRRVGNKDDAFVHSMTRLNASKSLIIPVVDKAPWSFQEYLASCVKFQR